MTDAPYYFDPVIDPNDSDQDKYRRATIRHFADNGLHVREDVRIYKLAYKLRGKRIVATVGDRHDRPGGDLVEFIFESSDQPQLYYVAGPYSGVMTGGPVMVGQDMSPHPTLFAEASSPRSEKESSLLVTEGPLNIGDLHVRLESDGLS